MNRIESIDQFFSLQGRLKADRKEDIPTLVIPAGTCGQASGANDLIRIAKREIISRKWQEKIRLRITGCNGFCQMEPLVVVEPGGTFYPKVGWKDLPRIMEGAIRGKVCEDLVLVDPDTQEKIEKKEDHPFFNRQTRTILSRSESIDPIRIYDYIASGGYSSFARVLSKGNPEWVIQEMKASGLRGRGGAGFPTGLKWEMLAREPNGRGKILVCNADEGDPGAYMDRAVLEGNPHSIIEGMLIGAYGTGATEGVVYIRDEYPLAIKHLVIALRQARELGLLGDRILGTDFSLAIDLMRGAGAFVCGEETALMRSIEGKVGEPRQRPPFPVQKGIEGKPTLINNVETWANVPIIFEKGAEDFRKTGTSGSSGTKIFSLVGKVRYTGLVEVPMGTTIQEIVYDIGGGPAGKVAIKAVQTGGPSGGCIPAKMFDLPIDYDSLTRAGTIMGSGGMIVMDEHTCMVDVAKYFMNFLKAESCGKCFTCRKGTQRMHEILDDISKGEAPPDHLGLLEELALAVKDTTLCGLGQTAPNPVLSTLRYFREEFLEHIEKKRCPAGVCKELVGAPCATACPLGTEAWRYIAHIQRSEYEEAYRVIRSTNPFPSICARVCHHPCEKVCRLGTSGSEPLAIRDLKRFITERFNPAAFSPSVPFPSQPDGCRIAIIGGGPAGLSAAHELSLRGYSVTVFEAEREAGGMLAIAIPPYRLPREILRREIQALANGKITFRFQQILGRDFSLDHLFQEGYQAVFLAIGAHKSRRLNLEGETADGVLLAIPFLKASNLEGKALAHGRVGVIGGGNSAIDAARVARRQPGVTSVTVLYRRTRKDMPAYPEEIEAALEEGIQIETRVSPVRILSPEGRLAGIELIRNVAGPRDQSGRRSPQPKAGSEFQLPLDTLIVAVGEDPELESLTGTGIETAGSGRVRVDPETLQTNRPGVFAGGDVVTGPNTVLSAMAAGKRAAGMIDRYIRGQELKEPAAFKRPQVCIEPPAGLDPEAGKANRAKPRRIPAESRRNSMAEVETVLPLEEAMREARRCLRCDLEFTRPAQMELSAPKGVSGP